jgi:hypothetical protein
MKPEIHDALIGRKTPPENNSGWINWPASTGAGNNSAGRVRRGAAYIPAKQRVAEAVAAATPQKSGIDASRGGLGGKTRRSSSCDECGKPTEQKKKGRKRAFCSDRCRDLSRRNRNFAVSGSVRGHSLQYPQNTENSCDKSIACKVGVGGRGSVDKALWSRIIETEIIVAHEWTPTTSADGVVSEQAILRRPALVRGWP